VATCGPPAAWPRAHFNPALRSAALVDLGVRVRVYAVAGPVLCICLVPQCIVAAPLSFIGTWDLGANRDQLFVCTLHAEKHMFHSFVGTLAHSPRCSHCFKKIKIRLRNLGFASTYILGEHTKFHGKRHFARHV
jgi:hypothetical protein